MVNSGGRTNVQTVPQRVLDKTGSGEIHWGFL